MKVCIGLISYLPDGGLRSHRLAAIQNLLNDFSNYFPNVDIIIISQNYKDFTPQSAKNKIIQYSYKNKLGILNARKILREKFIASDYDYLIMADDDLKLEGQKNNNYINLLEENPDKFGCFNFERGQLLLCAISKTLFEKVNYPDVDAEGGHVFEDLYLSKLLKYLCQDSIDFSACTVKPVIQRVGSTWWDSKKYDINRMVMNTNKLVQKDINKGVVG